MQRLLLLAAAALVATAAHAKPPRLPAPGGTGLLAPWGGADSSRWRPEAVVANAVSAALNAAWDEPGVRDVLVAVPGRFQDSGFRQFGDGQSNAALSLNGWTEKRPPLVAVLKYRQDGSSELEIHFDAAWSLTQSSLEILRLQNGERVTQTIPAARAASGRWTARWQNPPSGLVALVRPSPGFDDWLPLTFKHDVWSIGDLLADVPESQRRFSDGRSIVDAERLAQTATKTPFEIAATHAFPSGRYNQTPYVPANVHGELGANGIRTSVGRGFTWVAEHDTPFKIMYTCFERRQPALEASSPDGGVVSGSGWHRIGDLAETIINSVESEALVVASGVQAPAKRAGLFATSGGFAYGLSDVAVLRFLHPGEAFVTPVGLFEPNYHWYFIHTPREVCTEEWVHPCRPVAEKPGFRCACGGDGGEDAPLPIDEWDDLKKSLGLPTKIG